MTAIGFICLLVAFLLGWLDGFIDLPEWLAKAMGIVAMFGLVSFVSGLTVWIWRVMP
jgi:uncharacterized iron-regulated membrane protein